MSVNVQWDECVGFVQYAEKDAPDVRLFVGNCLLVECGFQHDEDGSVSLFGFFADLQHLKNIAKDGDLLDHYFDTRMFDEESGKVITFVPKRIHLNMEYFKASDVKLINRFFSEHNLRIAWYSDEYWTRENFEEKKRLAIE